MSTGYEHSGRSAQKGRTRAALVAAARDLVAAGLTPTVEDAAEAAAVSRTTAYRYFPNKQTLLYAAHPETAATSMLPADPPTDPGERLDAVVRNFSAMLLETEAQQRTMLRLSLENDPVVRKDLPLRQGRAIAWIAEAVDGRLSDLSNDQVHQLVVSIRGTIGIEALVWLIDVAGMSRGEAVALTRWSAQALLKQALSIPPPVAGHVGPPQTDHEVGWGDEATRQMVADEPW